MKHPTTVCKRYLFITYLVSHINLQALLSASKFQSSDDALLIARWALGG
jgi:hypothetical protein